jgi:pimeloyl-ACP methyl ester carboxylesterase
MAETRDQILARHFAMAFSSYKENGWSMQDAVIRTRQLIGLFTAKFGKLKDVFVTGHSMGGIISVMLAEKNPELLSGALPMAGPIGGGQMEIDYVANARILFDYFFPGVIRGNALEVPDDLNFYTEVIPAVLALFNPANPDIMTNVGKAMRLASVDQVAIQYLDVTELATAFLRALAYQVIGVKDMSGRTHQHVMTDNTQTVYTIGGVVQPDINAGVDRFSSTPDAENYLAHYYLPTGKLKIPMLTLHKTRDADVPIFHETAYAQIVAEAGCSDRLVQRTIVGFGHSNFTAAEHLQAFDDLVAWVKTGVKPAP